MGLNEESETSWMEKIGAGPYMPMKVFGLHPEGSGAPPLGLT